jgi:hypothetical protein
MIRHYVAALQARGRLYTDISVARPVQTLHAKVRITGEHEARTALTTTLRKNHKVSLFLGTTNQKYLDIITSGKF